ncbi:MAG: alcohol dehydrogenase catalytic domain-containing protein [Bacillota bacterium]|nr:alcohol dehydrogenase catalytic domain-containing protein [Bacillota bacterium]
MLAVRYYGIGDVRAEQIEQVRPEEGQALIKVIYGGICGSDLHIYRVGMFVEKVPETMGHEFVGEIVSAPAGSGLAAGDLVAGDPRVVCGQCAACLAGLSQSCASLGFIGEVRPGCFGEYVALEAEKLIKFSRKIDAKQAALAEPLAVAVHAARRIAAEKVDNALVVGAGPIGLLIAFLLKHEYHFAQIGVTDIDDYRLGLAEKAGADRTGKDIALLAGQYDVLIDAVGQPKVFHSMLESAKPAARIHVSAVYEHIPECDLNELVHKELALKGNNCYSFADLQEAVDILSAEKYDFSWLISRVLPAARAAEAFALLTAKEKQDMKILLDFS